MKSRLYLVLVLAFSACQAVADDAKTYDVVIYGGTTSGIAAAVQVRRMGKSVLLIEPTHRLGGLSSGGLGQTDIGNKSAIGGIASEFYQQVKKHYEDPKAWTWQKPQEHRDEGQSRTESGDEAK